MAAKSETITIGIGPKPTGVASNIPYILRTGLGSGSSSTTTTPGLLLLLGVG
jgi:hypothetical protein